MTQPTRRNRPPAWRRLKNLIRLVWLRLRRRLVTIEMESDGTWKVS